MHDTTMMLERDYDLDQADWHIAETKQLITRQRELIAVLQLIKQPTDPALSMLEALQKSLEAFEAHRLNIDLVAPGSPTNGKRVTKKIDATAAHLDG